MAQLFELPIRHLMHSKILSARHLVLMPVMIYPERADCHILADEKSSREYIEQVWAEAMELYRSGNHKLMLSKESTEYLSEYQKQFMLEDADAGMIIDFLDNYKGDRVCTKLLWKEALHTSIQCLSPAKKYKLYKSSINKSIHFVQRSLSSSTRG